MLEVNYLTTNGLINSFMAVLLGWAGVECLNLFLIIAAIPVAFTGIRDLIAAMNLENWEEEKNERK